jgi:catalase
MVSRCKTERKTSASRSADLRLVNAPQCPFHSYHRDGKMRTDGNLGATTNYNPNSQALWDNQPEYAEPSLTLEGDADHYDHRLVEDHWEQPGNLFRMLKPDEQQRLFENTARAIGGASKEVQDRHIGNCSKADPTYGEGVAKAIAALQEQGYRSPSAANGSIVSRNEVVHEQVRR